jgi:hypothetical protein
LPALARAEDKEPFALIELGAARERSSQEASTVPNLPFRSSFLSSTIGLKSRSVSRRCFGRVRRSGRPDVLFKKPFTLSDKVEFIVGVGPQFSYATFGGGTKVAAEVLLEWMMADC